jgi:hypothetical protein
MDVRDAEKLPNTEPAFPELTKLRANDRQQHIQKALDAGMTREEAERHADEDLRERDDSSS